MLVWLLGAAGWQRILRAPEVTPSAGPLTSGLVIGGLWISYNLTFLSPLALLGILSFLRHNKHFLVTSASLGHRDSLHPLPEQKHILKKVSLCRVTAMFGIKNSALPLSGIHILESLCNSESLT